MWGRPKWEARGEDQTESMAKPPPSIHVCEKCAFLLHKYRRKVHEFLKDPPTEWMTARGYDEDMFKFTKDCEAWKAALRVSCTNKECARG
jgi:hypothetical protein